MPYVDVRYDQDRKVLALTHLGLGVTREVPFPVTQKTTVTFGLGIQIDVHPTGETGIPYLPLRPEERLVKLEAV